jgi:hypothetical protein
MTKRSDVETRGDCHTALAQIERKSGGEYGSENPGEGDDPILSTSWRGPRRRRGTCR